MTFSQTAKIGVAIATLAVGSAHAISVTTSTDANALAAALVDASTVTISNATLTGGAEAGFFTAGTDGVGFAQGIFLTTGVASCIPGPNSSGNCDGAGTTSSSLKFDFTSTTSDVFFKYSFGSEEYNEFVGSSFNDIFELRLDGVNIALLPAGGGVVSINNVNNNNNSAFYVDNSGTGARNIGYDGITVVLNAQALGLSTGNHTFEFFITDAGDSSLDSGVFIQAGSFSGNQNPAPAPGIIGLLALGALALGARRKA